MEPEMSRTLQTYSSFLLRLWQDHASDQEPIVRASLQSSLTGERLAFASLDQLFDFLRQGVGSGSATDGPDKAAGER
jgi:hypothetical protein